MTMKQEFVKAVGKGLFVTATGTGIGKTMVTGAIAHQLASTGYRAGVFKPIATGCQSRREGLVSPDAEFLAHCADSEFSLEQINPIRYQQPLAPSVAAELSQKEIDWPALRLAYKNVAQNSDFMLVEGIGGVLVPLTNGYLVADLIADMDLPVLIVARNQLGAINHVLLTIEACRARNLKIAGLIFNAFCHEAADLAQETNPAVIAEISGIKILAVLPYDKNSSVETGRLGEDITNIAGMTNWRKCITSSRCR